MTQEWRKAERERERPKGKKYRVELGSGRGNERELIVCRGSIKKIGEKTAEARGRGGEEWGNRSPK